MESRTGLYNFYKLFVLSLVLILLSNSILADDTHRIAISSGSPQVSVTQSLQLSQEIEDGKAVGFKVLQINTQIENTTYLKKNDVILSYNGKKLDQDNLMDFTQHLGQDDVITVIEIFRNKKPETLTYKKPAS